MTVGLVLVSHSARLADGAVELAAQMAPDVRIVAAGGSPDGGLGTSFDLVTAALAEAESGDGVVVVYDLGSALLIAETAVELLDPARSKRVMIVDAPFAEGAVAAAVAAQGGAGLVAVARAAEGGREPEPDRGGAPGVSTVVTLRNPLGLHARPAAELARVVAGLAADVSLARLGGPSADVRDVLAVLALALRGDERITVSARGIDARAALDRVRELIDAGFGELADPAGGSTQP